MLPGESHVKTSLQWWLMLSCLAIPGVSTATEKAAEAVAATQVRAAAETAAQGGEESGLGGVFSSILKFLRGRSESSDPEPQQAREGEQAPTQVDIQVQPDDTQPVQGFEPKRVEPRESLLAEDREREGDSAEVTHSDVYRATVDLIGELDILRDVQGIADERPAEPPSQPDQHPIRAFVKSLTVMNKTARVQRRLGMIPVEVRSVPVGPIAPHHVLRSVDAVLEELRRIKRQLVVTEEIEPALLAGGKTPSLVYQRLSHASLLLDALVGRPPSSNEFYMYVSQLHDQMKPLGAKLGAVLEREPPAVEGARAPVECGQQVLRAIYKAVNLQSRLGMDASTVPDLTLEQAGASDIFGAANILLAEIVRIKIHLRIDTPGAERRQASQKHWRDVFAQLLLVVANLDHLIRAVEESGKAKRTAPMEPPP